MSSLTGDPANLTEDLSRVDLESIRAPALIVSHQGDLCAFTNSGGFQSAQKALFASERAKFRDFNGGSAPLSDPCDPLAPHTGSSASTRRWSTRSRSGSGGARIRRLPSGSLAFQERQDHTRVRQRERQGSVPPADHPSESLHGATAGRVGKAHRQPPRLGQDHAAADRQRRVHDEAPAQRQVRAHHRLVGVELAGPAP